MDAITTLTSLMQYEFWRWALGIGITLGISCGILGTYVMIRGESNIAHTIAHRSLLGISIGWAWELPLNLTIILGACIGACALIYMQRANIFGSAASNEIISQAGLVGALIILTLRQGYKGGLTNFLFGDILTSTQQDFWLALGICVLVIGLRYRGRSYILLISIAPDIARSKKLPIGIVHAIYIIILSVVLALASGILGTLLVAAFLVIPANIAKLTASGHDSMVMHAVCYSVVSVIGGLLTSSVYDIPSGAAMVAILLCVLFLVSIFWKRI